MARRRVLRFLQERGLSTPRWAGAAAKGPGFRGTGRSVGRLFHQPAGAPGIRALVAVQLYQMWRILDCPSVFTVLEPGAGDGLLCRDVLDYAGQVSREFRDSLRYLCIDRGVKAGHEQGLEGAHRIVSNTLPVRAVVGCVLSNELLDAFPVRQVVMEPEGLREVYVSQVGGILFAFTDYTFDVGRLPG